MTSRKLLAWIKRNKTLFRTPPVLIDHRPGQLLFTHRGVINWVQSHISFRGNTGSIDIVVITSPDGEWDRLMCSDIDVAQDNRDNVYCTRCESSGLFASEDQLWESHLHNEWVKTLNSYAQRENHLMLFGDNNRWSSAIICDPVRYRTEYSQSVISVPYMD